MGIAAQPVQRMSTGMVYREASIREKMTRRRHAVSKGVTLQTQRAAAAAARSGLRLNEHGIGLKWTARFHGTYAEHLRI